MFKYTTKEVADYLFNDDSIQIGTLHYYKKMENTKGISDPLEGTYIDHFAHRDFSVEEYNRNPKIRESLKGFIDLPAKLGKGCVISGNRMTSRKRSPNFLMFCTSHSKSKDTMSLFDGADTCIEIVDQQKFFTLITQALIKKLKTKITFTGSHPVDYGPFVRERKEFDFLNPALAKTLKFEEQYEMRSIWQHDKFFKLSESPKILSVPGIHQCCKIINLDELQLHSS